MTSNRPNRLRELREAAGLSRRRLSVELDIDSSTIFRWERGERNIPDPQKLWLAQRFGVTRAYLMGWDTDTAKTGKPNVRARAAA